MKNEAYGATAYVSYARIDESQFGMVKLLQQDFSCNWVHLKVDENELKPRESFDDFMQDIGRAACVVIVFSENYLQSFYCMLELTRIMQNGNALERVYPVFVDDGFRLDGSIAQWKAFWQEKFESWHPASTAEPGEMTGVYGSKEECSEILAEIESAFEIFGRRLAGQVPRSNPSVVEWVKTAYFKRIQSEVAFNNSIKNLKSCHKKDFVFCN